MVSTTAPMDSSLMQVGVKEVTVGSMEHCLNHYYCHILTLTSAPTSFQFTAQSFSTDGERTPTPFCTLSSLCPSTPLASTHSILYNHSCW